MVQFQRDAESNVVYFIWKEHSSLHDLLQSMTALQRGNLLSLPFIHDMRNVDPSKMTSDQMETYIAEFQATIQQRLDNKCAFVVSDLTRYGKLRLWGVMADLSGLRDEDLTLVTMSIGAAATWVMAKPRATDVSRLVQRISLAQSTATHAPN